MQSNTRLGLVVVGLLSLSQLGTVGFCGGNNNGPPEPDDCNNPSNTAIVTQVEIGPGEASTFEEWQGGEPVHLVTGGQGSDMLVVKIRVTGSELPDCMMQRTVVRSLDTKWGETTYSSHVRWYGTPDLKNTAPVYIVIDGYLPEEMPIEVETTVREVVVTRQLWLGDNPPGDAAPVDATLDAGPMSVDADLLDAPPAFDAGP